MLKYIKLFERIFKKNKTRPFVLDRSKNYAVTFEGGMGAQIISAAIYHDLINNGYNIHADMSYFDVTPCFAREGDTGKCTHWHWQLECFGMHKDSFKGLTGEINRDVIVLRDGVEKFKLGLDALSKPGMQEIFSVDNELVRSCASMVQGNYLCVHMRRGDYLNVGSHIISDGEFIDIISKFKKIFNTIVVLSDSQLSESVKSAVSAVFGDAKFLDNIDAVRSHVIMRSASVLVCSNSQFSLVAAALNRDGFNIVPKQWFSGDARQLEAVIDMKCQFQVYQG